MLIVDVETTGQNPTLCSIASIGAVYVAGPCAIPQTFYGDCCIPARAVIEKEALAVNGFTEHDLRDPRKLSLECVLETFFTWMRGWELPLKLKQFNGSHSPMYTLFGQNPNFDRDFLYHNAKHCDLRSPFGNLVVDLHAVCASTLLRLGMAVPSRYEKSALRADAIFELVGIGSEPRPHHGLCGAIMEAESFHRLLYGKYLFEEYKSKPVPRFLRF